MIEKDIYIKLTFQVEDESKDEQNLRKAFSELIKRRKRCGFLIAHDLDALLDLESENPYILYCGNKKLYREWIDMQIKLCSIRKSYFRDYYKQYPWLLENTIKEISDKETQMRMALKELDKDEE